MDFPGTKKTAGIAPGRAARIVRIPGPGLLSGVEPLLHRGGRGAPAQSLCRSVALNGALAPLQYRVRFA